MLKCKFIVGNVTQKPRSVWWHSPGAGHALCPQGGKRALKPGGLYQFPPWI